jgi:hypothetical protein
MSESDDVIMNELRNSGNYSPDASDSDVWANYRDRTFVGLTRQGRTAAIKWVDDRIGGDEALTTLHATRESAKLHQRLRELKSSHEALWRAGR